jgi:hypothetical protein
MRLILLFLAIVAFFYISVSIWNAFQRRKGLVAAANNRSCNPADEGCCGRHAVCEKLNGPKAIKVEYFDDEELDSYAGIASDDYSEEAVEQFREILHSMYDKDKPCWLRSLQQRRIAVPDQLKEELSPIKDGLFAVK